MFSHCRRRAKRDERNSIIGGGLVTSESSPSQFTNVLNFTRLRGLFRNGNFEVYVWPSPGFRIHHHTNRASETTTHHSYSYRTQPLLVHKLNRRGRPCMQESIGPVIEREPNHSVDQTNYCKRKCFKSCCENLSKKKSKNVHVSLSTSGPAMQTFALSSGF